MEWGPDMRRLALLLPLALCGCSTAPAADFLDWARPARPVPADVHVRGGVGGPPPGEIPPPPGYAAPVSPPAPPAAPALPAPEWPK
jgi:hypothetical protein